MIMNSCKYIFEKEEAEEQLLTFNYFNNICDKNNIPHDERNLRSLGIINTDNSYTNLGLILSDQCPLSVKFAKYDNNMNFITKKEFSGSILKSLDTTIEQCNIFNDVSAVIDGKTFKRIEKYSYPIIALREAILNAFAHADYLIRSNIKIEFFSNKVKISNPGGIYDATLHDILTGTQTFRNPGLIRILDKLGYIENFGMGLFRIQESYKPFTNKPNFTPSQNFFKLELPNLNYFNESSNDPINDPINDLELLILKTINNNPGVNVNKIYNLLHLKDDTITIDKIKNSLKRGLSNLVVFKGSKKTGGYYKK